MRGVAWRLIILTAVLLPVAAGVRSPARQGPQSSAKTATAPAGFVGVGGCAAMACHGGTRANERSEYTTWVERDRHARAFLDLYEERSLRIARNLEIGRPEQDARCLACHSTAADAVRGPRFSLEDGVSCEACHGAAERWLVPHTKPGWKTKQPAEKYDNHGMTNTKDLLVRAQVCTKCHVGEPGREVNHDLIAAGHPPLLFELDAFTANLPPHWRETPDRSAGARAWAVGQTVSLRQSLILLADRAKRGQWPEFADFECYACHHELGDKSWRQQVGYGERPPGSPVWSNPQLSLVLRSVSDPSHPDEYTALRSLMENVKSPASEVATAADRAATSAARLIEQVGQETWQPDRLRRLLAVLAAEPPSGSLDYTTAAYTTMALGALTESIASGESTAGGHSTNWAAKLRPTIDRLYDDVQQASTFDAMRFTDDLKLLRQAFQP